MADRAAASACSTAPRAAASACSTAPRAAPSACSTAPVYSTAPPGSTASLPLTRTTVPVSSASDVPSTANGYLAHQSTSTVSMTAVSHAHHNEQSPPTKENDGTVETGSTEKKEKKEKAGSEGTTISKGETTGLDGASEKGDGATGSRKQTGEGTEKGGESESDDDPEEILEESPCKRWSKRREQVKQRDVPGIDVAYLAMDNETGNEVVWNEVQFSERKNFRAQEDKINVVFDNLMQLDHTNLVKFHKYWTDVKSEQPRVIFITEYMSCGSMSRFLQRTRNNREFSLSIKAWKKWCTQILSALNYLHSCDPPIVHGNLTCNTIFIQQNGLIKLGCVAPNAIHHHVKTFEEKLEG